MNTETESEFVEHIACDECGSSDANSLYTDNHTFCFNCSTHKHGDQNAGTTTPKEPKGPAETFGGFIRGEYVDLRKRCISAETCRDLGYEIGTYQGQPCHIANIYNDKGQKVAQKLRLPNKEFRVLGDLKAGGLIFQEKCKPNGKRVVVTEGELDALSYRTVAPSWQVVSVPNGAAGAVKAVKRSLEFLESFEEGAVFMFDSDEAGMAAARECAQLMSPNKAKICELPLKDANEMLVSGRIADLKNAVYNARPFSPEGIVLGSDLTIKELQEVTPKGKSIPFAQLNGMIRGLRKRELVMVTAGSGIGKSTFTREIGYHLTVEHGQKIGYVMLEESVAKTAQAMVAIHNNTPLGDLMETPEVLTDEQWQDGYDSVVSKSAFYDSFGSSGIDVLLSKIRYLAVGLDCDFVVLDHVSMVVSDGAKDDERKALDELMTKLRSLVENTGIGVIAVSHIKRGSGDKSYNEGAQISLTSLRGSASLEQLSDICIALERDQQSEDQGNIAQIRLLKNRPFGQVGPAGHLRYDVPSGRMVHHEIQEPPPPTQGFDPFSDVPF